MNPIAGLSIDVIPESRGESPAPGVTGDADSAEFGLALALAAAAQSQPVVAPPAASAVAPVPVFNGDARDPAVADATRALVENENVADALAAVPRPARPVLAPLPVTIAGTVRPPVAPLPARPVVAGFDAALPPAPPAGRETPASPPLPVTLTGTVRPPVVPLPAGPGVAELEGTPPAGSLAQPKHVRSPVSPAVPSVEPSAPPVAPEVATAARDAELRMADLPLTIRVLELVRGMTEQAARVALDAAMSAGPAQFETVPRPARPVGAPIVAAEASRLAQAAKVLEALPGPGGLDRSRGAVREPLRPVSEAEAPGDGWLARGAVSPRPAVSADPLMPAPRSDLHAVSVAPAQVAPATVVAVDERSRGRSSDTTKDDDGPTRAAGAMLADSSAARASLADEAVPVAVGAASQNLRPSAGPMDPTAGTTRTTAVPLEARTLARPGDQVTLQFSGEDGLEGQLRVAVRGQNVRATILADDPISAERFSRGLDGLQRALLERGFSEARLNVQQTARSEGSAFGNAQRDGNQGESQPRGESRDRYSSSRQERESASPEDRPDRRQSRQRTER